MVSIYSPTRGSVMGASRPASSAMARKVRLRSLRSGNPKETLLAPRVVLTPNRALTRRMASRVSLPASCLAETVNVRQSTNIRSLPMPYFSASRIIRSAIATRSSAFFGRPFSSKVKAMTQVPYFLTMGKMASITSCFPLTELMIGRPL